MTLEATSGTNPDSTLEYTIIVVTRGDEDDKEFLMVRHRERGWELPGGKISETEGPVHCALREFREETGHLIADPKFVTKYMKDNGKCYVFTGRLGPKVQELHEKEVIDTMRWYSKLPRDAGLAFPDDPYEDLGAKLGINFG